jgi:hypothetical protein
MQQINAAHDSGGGLDGGISAAPTPADLDADRPAAARINDWTDAGCTSPTAIADWTSIGIDTPAVARQWVDPGFTAESAARWIDVPDMTPNEAATCAEAGMTPPDVQRIRRADPGWARTDPVAEAAAPDTGIGM